MIANRLCLREFLRHGLLGLLAALTFSLATAAPAPIVRSQLTPVQARVGEVVMLDLVILVPGWLTAPIDLPTTLDIPGVQARLDEGAALNVNETIAGVAYAGVRRRYQLVAQSAGQFAVPAVSFSLAFADGSRRVTQPVNLTPASFTTTLPKGLEGLGYMLVTSDFRLQQSIDRKLSNLQVGDAQVRTLEQRAVGHQATQLPVLRFADTPGLATYPEAPSFNETIGERSAASFATQTQRVTYVLERAGGYELPALELRWLDSRTGAMRTARAPAVKFEVQGAAFSEPEPARPSATLPVQPATDKLPLTARLRLLAARFWPWLAGIAFLLLARRKRMTR